MTTISPTLTRYLSPYLDHRVDVPEGTSGEWSIRKRIVDESGASGHNLRAAFHGGREILPSTYTELWQGNRLWMSDTPAEIGDLMRVCRWEQGSVLVVGLGLGVAVKMLLAQPGIERIDVLELDPDVIALAGPTYADPRVTITQGDAYSYRWPKGTTWDYVWLDIWESICSDNLREMGRLKRYYRSRARQGVYCWCERECQAARYRWGGR